ncbi:aspartate-alanine antiporter [uncultured Shewanella sp.]|uniref:aspartate-alanine antiporter n=1 Tax=uncultured Shewanella sp. TaxID=173975 RepID=UPI0026056093|nr:aspartate-alanine antiporter [uncultured Shewanella sp.]
MDILHSLFKASPLIAVFITLTLGYLVGKITIGRFVLGGVAGTLIMGVFVGQIGVEIDDSIRNIFFALFIYAVGFQGGPRFFSALNLRTLNILISAMVMTITGLICVLIAAWLFDLDRGTAAGLAAGGLTQSSIIGTAGDAISQLADVSEHSQKIMQTNVAVGYAVTYIFGSLGPILMVTWFFPMVMNWDLRTEAIKLANQTAPNQAELEPGQFNAIERVVTRAYCISKQSLAINRDISEINKELNDAAIEVIERNGSVVSLKKEETLQQGDIVIVTGVRARVKQLMAYFGEEVDPPNELELVEEHRHLIVNNAHLVNHTLQTIKQETDIPTRRGVYLTEVKRSGEILAIDPQLILKKGDEIEVTGAPKDLNRVEKTIGHRLISPFSTDFVFFGVGMTLGILIGQIHFSLFGIPVTIGSGVGCLISGLILGWARSRHPRFASLPMGASNFLRDFGLAVFVGLVGLTAGPQAVITIKEYGMTLLFLGIGVTLIPQIITFYFSYYVLRIKNPIEAMGCLVGGRSANPGFAALLDKAGNSTPVFSFTVTYALANVLLTLWGPIIVGIITQNAN